MPGTDRLAELLRTPVVVAPMAGGPSTVDLVVAATEAGALGILAAGYRSPGDVGHEIDAVRARTSEAFGVNVFVPGAPTSDPEAVSRYLAQLRAGADEGAAPGEPTWDDDGWAGKLDVLLDRVPPLVSFTFGCPPADVVRALQRAGSAVAVTVTEVGEAERAAATGADCLVVQGSEAGAHRGTFANDDTALHGRALHLLLPDVVAAVPLPVFAAGGIMDAGDTATALAAGARAVQCGTAFLRCPESGAHPRHKQALAERAGSGTVVTRAFSGRPARALANRFAAEHPDAPAAYPEVNNATRPLRAAAARAGDVERMSLWAGTGVGRSTALPAGEVAARLLPRR